MTTKRALLVSIIILAGVSLVGAQSPISPNASPEASASPAKKVRKKKAEASPAPATSPEASASPAKTRGRKKAETSPAASPAERQARKKAGASPTAAPAASASPAKPFSLGSLFKPKPTASPATTTGSAEPNATPAPGGGHGLVWVNTESHIYHKESSRFYGKTKQGKYVSEADAIKEGDRASKTND